MNAKNATNRMTKFGPSLSSHISTYTKDTTATDPKAIMTNNTKLSRSPINTQSTSTWLPTSTQLPTNNKYARLSNHAPYKSQQLVYPTSHNDSTTSANKP